MRNLRTKVSMWITLLVLVVCMVGVLPAKAMDNTKQSIFGQDITSSRATLEAHFSISDPTGVTYELEEQTPLIHAKRTDKTTLLLSHEPVQLTDFVFTVEATSAQHPAMDIIELPIIVAFDQEAGQYIQVYITKVSADTVHVRAALHADGVYSEIWMHEYYVENAEMDDTFFEVTMESYGEEMDVYVNGDFIETITRPEGFSGHVGIRCTGDMKIRKLSLVDSSEVSTIEPTVSASPTQTPEVSSSATKEPIATVSTPDASPDNSNESTGLSSGAIGGIIVGILAFVCVLAIVIYTVIAKKKKV